MLVGRGRRPTIIIIILCATLLTFIQQIEAIHRQLSKSELIHTFGVHKIEHVPEYEVIEARRYHDESGRVIRIHFLAWNETYEIELKPNHRLISPYIKTKVYDVNSSTTFDGLLSNSTANCHFHGRVVSHGHLRAAVSDCSKLSGVIVADDHFLMLQTLPEKTTEFEQRRHVVYKRSAALINPLENYDIFEKAQKRRKRASNVNLRFAPSDTSNVNFNVDFGDESKARKDAKSAEELEEFCDISKSIDEPSALLSAANAFSIDNNLLHLNYTIPPEAKLDSLYIFSQLDPITLEIGLFLDSQLYEHFQREFTVEPERHLTDFSLALINNVHVLYQQPTLTPNLEIVIVHFEMWKKQPPQLVTEVHRNGQAQTLLDSFCRHQARINPGTDLTDPNHWDHGVLLTGYDIYHTTSSVAGVAPVGRMCDELFACSLVEGLHLGRSFVLAHEMGHNMGMVHDGVQNQCGRSCCLMSAVNGAGKTTWSTCSVREFNAFLLQLDDSGRGNCLRDPAESIATHNHLKDGRLPGQRFTADQQCSYFWGRNYQVEIPNGRSYEDICRILWCGNSGSTISTAHPALEGSWCGGERWCHEGRCEVWNRLASPVPKVVDGQWSDWSSAEKKCPITPCQVTGSIVLTNQLRTCTNPAPNNGGRPCSGLNVRGLVCGSAKSTCESFGRQEFGDRLCSAIRNDIHWPDVQLSGLSFLHATQPCKVWCHVRDSELIRNKGQFPNGSPCGDDGHYCVGGTCLRLSCRNRAVVDSDTDCPPEEATGVGDKKTAKWEPWSDWSECSVKCGTHGVQKRTRKCRSVESECNGKSSEVRACDPMPPKCVKYSEWGDWSKCSAVCGGKSTGKRRRERACEAGPCQLKELEREEDCRNEDLCPAPEWQPWGEWSTCSVTCGHGQRKRRRVCRQRADSDSGVESDAECEGEASIIESCVLQECPADEKTKNATERSKTDTKNAGYNGSSGDSADQVFTWSEWLPCSVSCGIGFQLREGLCDGKPCRQRRKQARTCNMQDCSKVLSGGVMSEWSLWSACSRTCGQGFQYRHRKCLNAICAADVARSEHRRCVLGPCPTWTEWEQWSFDCASCSLFEARKRRRKCKVTMADEETLVADESCSGAAFEVENCENACASRNQFQQQPSLREHTEGTRRLFGAPIVTAERQTPEVSPPDKESYWGEWTSWSSCSRVCGNGWQTRTRACRIALTFLCDGTAQENRPCNTFACIAQNLIQAAPAIPTWSEWSEFSKCSCFTLTMFRRRYCQVIDPAVQGFCAGSVIQQRPCKPVSCAAENGGWSEWSDWSRCSRECGASAHQIRNRMCASPLPSNRGAYCVGYSFDQRPCDHPVPTECEQLPGDGGWSNWTEWSECSDPCLNGQRSRTRYCTNPRPANDGRQCDGLDFELQPCSNAEACAAFAGEQSLVQTNGTMVTVVPRDGGLSVWSPWSSCTTTCGLAAFQSRQRVCDSPPPAAGGRPCSGLVYMTSVCRTESACPNAIDGQWGSWSAWSESNCESTCIEFNGMRTRTRECVSPAPANGGLPCFGRFVERAPCINTTQNAYAPLAICRITERIRFIDGEALAVLNAI